MRLAVVLVVLLLGAAPAWADAQLYADGNYGEAIRTGLARNDASGFADAARAALADEATRDKPCLDCLQKAESYARRAIAADPRLPDGQVYLAITLGLESRIIGSDAARRAGYAGEAKQALDAAFAVDPDNPWVLAGLGGWNIEVVRGGGSFLAYLLYDATISRGLDYFARAFKAAPDNLAIRYQYALSLSGYDAQRFHDVIGTSLERVAGGKAGTAYERLLQKRAEELLGLIRKGDSDAFAKRVRKYEGYP